MPDNLNATMCPACAAAPVGTSDTGLKMRNVNGVWRVFGAIPRKPGLKAKTAAEWLDAKAITPMTETDWPKYETVTLQPHVKHILDQDGVGSCATEDTAQMLMVTASKQGQPVELLNPWTLYRQVTNADNGSDTLEDVQYAAKVGICPMEYWDRAQHSWKSSPPSGWEKVAGNYQIDEYLELTKEAELQTLLRLGIVCGWSNSSYWGGGHSVCAIAARNNGDILIANSWATTWGDGGFGWIPRAHVKRGFQEGFSQVAVLSIKYSGDYTGGPGAA